MVVNFYKMTIFINKREEIRIKNTYVFCSKSNTLFGSTSDVLIFQQGEFMSSKTHSNVTEETAEWRGVKVQ